VDSSLIFSLDLGTASIGWSAYRSSDIEQGEILGLGVRSFEEPVEAKSREPKNAKRRTARGARRVTGRRKERKRLLLSILQQNQLAPDSNAIEEWTVFNPYELRAKALDEKLSIPELGRALYHLGQRRGFLSNRKTRGLESTGIEEVDQLIELDEQADLEHGRNSKGSDEDSQMLVSIAALQNQIEAGGFRTVGEYFATKLSEKERIRARHTLRAMFSHEFELIWEFQKQFYPEKLTDALKLQIERSIFFQNPLKPVLRGKCSLEENKPVTMRAHSLFQEARIWQELANITIQTTNDWQKRGLTIEERGVIFDRLNSSRKLTWTEFRKILQLPKKDKAIINLEENAQKKHLDGNITNASLIQATDQAWSKLDQETRDVAMDTLVSRLNDKEKLVRLVNKLNIRAPIAYKLVIASLPDGTASLSLKAIKKLIPHLRDGLNYYDAKISAGYTPEHEREHPTNDILEWEKLENVRNPGVLKCTYETRKLINALIRKYGKPDEIKIELARELGQGRQEKLDILAANKKNEKLNDEARRIAAENGVSKPSRTDAIKYRLWVECNQQCPFTGKPIPLSALWTEKWNIEHIIPFSISLDDSFANKTLCDAEFNQNIKRNRLPTETFAGNPDEWNQVLLRINNFKSGLHKKNLFQLNREDIPDDFKSRQLNDTRYASVLVRDFLKKLGIPVSSCTGKHTSDLRRHWGLHTILDEEGKKNRDDHRHHAIDALVVGLTTPAYVKRIADLYKSGGSLQLSSQRVPLPWLNIREDVKNAVDKIIVTHEPRHKVRGALHEETGYGRSKVNQKFTTRKAIETLTPGEVERIVDPALRKKIEEHVFSSEGKWEDKMANFRIIDKNGVIHHANRVKIYARGESEDRYLKTNRGYFPSGANQWLIITNNRTTNARNAHIIPLYKATLAIKNNLPMKDLIPSEEDFVFLLQKNDMVELAGDKPGIYRVVKFSIIPNIYITFRPHNRADDAADVRVVSLPKLNNIVKLLRVGMIDVT